MLSFIVPAYNEELELPSTLSAIHAAATANSKRYEIIVVNDASTDATAAVAVSGGARVVTIDRRQIAAARNAGASAARGEILFFVDADTRISPAHVAGALDALDAGCAGGGARVMTDGAVPLWGRVFIRVFSAFYFTAANLGAGAFLFTTPKNFQAAGGFDNRLFAGEEIYFSKALKKQGQFRVLREPILTSGRKLRMHSGWRILGLSMGLILRGKRGVKSRDKLDLWYDGKRETKTHEPVAEAARD